MERSRSRSLHEQEQAADSCHHRSMQSHQMSGLRPTRVESSRTAQILSHRCLPLILPMATTTSRDGRSLALVAMLALPSMGYAFSMAGRTVVTPSSALRRPQYRPVMMADPGDVQSQIAALQQQLEMIKLQAQIKELEAKTAAQAPLPVEAPQPVAAVPEIATIPPPAVKHHPNAGTSPESWIHR